jgi:amidase
MAKDINGLVEGMELLQEDFDTLYAKAQAAKPSARQIRIGLLRIPGTDPAIDRAIEARLAERGSKSFHSGRNFSRCGSRRSATGT